MRTFIAMLLSTVFPLAHAGQGRVLFVCEADNAATCELAARLFEGRARREGLFLDGLAATVDGLDAAALALAQVVITVDADLYRQWLRDIGRLETWRDVPQAQAQPDAAQAELEQRIASLRFH